MNLKTIVESFHRDGFVIVRQVFTQAEVARTIELVEDFIRTVVPKLGPGSVYYEDSPARPIKALHGLDEHTDVFAPYLRDRRILDILEAFWPGAEVFPKHRSVAFFAKPARDGSVTPPHQDNAFQFWKPPYAAIMTIALDESTPENGPLICARGSHQALLRHRPSGVMGFSKTIDEPFDTRRFPEVSICMKPGDVSIHHIQTVHRSEANRSDRSRRQLAFVYQSKLAKQDPDEVARHTQLLKAMHADHK